MAARAAASARTCTSRCRPRDDGVLRRMRRRYDTALARERLAMIRELLPDAAIGTDLIAGFPGEDDAAFERTLALRRGEPDHLRARLPVLRRAAARRPPSSTARCPPRRHRDARARGSAPLGERKRHAFARRFDGRDGRGAGRDHARPADRRAPRLHAELPPRAPRRAGRLAWARGVPVRLARRRRRPRRRRGRRRAA